MNAPEAIAFLGLAFVLGKIFGPIAAAIGGRLRGRSEAPDHQLASEVDELLLARGGEADQIQGSAIR